jgi:hypothetical protein
MNGRMPAVIGQARSAIGIIGVLSFLAGLPGCSDTKKTTGNKANWPTDNYKPLAVAPPPQTLWQKIIGIAATQERERGKLRGESAIAAIQLLKKEAATGGQFVEVTTVTHQQPFVVRLIESNGIASFDMHAQGGRVYAFHRERGGLLTATQAVTPKAHATRLRLISSAKKTLMLPLNKAAQHRWPERGFIETFPQTLLLIADFDSGESVIFLQSIYRRSYGTGRSRTLLIQSQQLNDEMLKKTRLAFERRQKLPVTESSRR